MSIWPILITSLIIAIFASRRQRARVWLERVRQQDRQLNNKDELRKSLDTLVDFLSKHEQYGRVRILQGIRGQLDSTATEADALSRLSTLFGGMGSFNDIVLDTPEATEECGRLLDAVFRDMKLYHGTHEHRALWRKLEEEHKDDELRPRIKHAFRKE